MPSDPAATLRALARWICHKDGCMAGVCNPAGPDKYGCGKSSNTPPEWHDGHEFTPAGPCTCGLDAAEAALSAAQAQETPEHSCQHGTTCIGPD